MLCDDAKGGEGRTRASTIIADGVLPMLVMSDNDSIDAAAKFHDKFMMDV
jgi:hypothetical protein